MVSNLAPQLNPANHDRDSAGMTYVYPVVSRRAGGVSVGINLSPNNACNWACNYCQVPNLVRGSAPAIDLIQLESELRRLLWDILHGDFMRTQVPEGAQRLTDIALSGNGEPTSAKVFSQVVDRVGNVIADCGLTGKIKLILITNGSLVDRPRVQEGLRKMARLNGEVWFKVDSATASGMRRINQTLTAPEKHYERLKLSSSLCPTWIQTCVFLMDGHPPDDAEQAAYLRLAQRIRRENLSVQGVLLYGLARSPQQPGGERLSALNKIWLDRFAERIRDAGLPCKVTL